MQLVWYDKNEKFAEFCYIWYMRIKSLDKGKIMDIISSKDVMNVVRRALNLIDRRLIHHGERVGYILYKMLCYENKYNRSEIINLTITGILHDIGAYKNEELDNMLAFETHNVWGHSIYGYLFLRYLSPLAKYSDIILYHHLDYIHLNSIETEFKEVAGYLNLADRVDICLNNCDNKSITSQLQHYKSTKFSKRSLELFGIVDEEYHIIEHLKDNSYLEELNHILEEVKFTKKEKDDFLKMLVYSIDFRSEYTVMHTITTVSIADEIGRLMGLSDYDQTNLYYGALLHDIGKITTPIHILEAPRKLTDDEMFIMKNHVEMSEFILKDYILEDIQEIAISHHEKLDGTGYPKKLTKEELTKPQRILAVADIISALTGKRSYKDSFSKEKIVDIITKDAIKGKLCSETVNCVLTNFDDIMKNVSIKTSEPLNIYAAMKNKYLSIYEELQLINKNKSIL